MLLRFVLVPLAVALLVYASYQIWFWSGTFGQTLDAALGAERVSDIVGAGEALVAAAVLAYLSLRPTPRLRDLLRGEGLGRLPSQLLPSETDSVPGEAEERAELPPLADERLALRDEAIRLRGE